MAGAELHHVGIPLLVVAHPALPPPHLMFVGIIDALVPLLANAPPPPMFTVSRKQPGQSLGAMGVTGHSQSRLFYITDHNTGLRLLVDTGAEVSIVPPSASEHKYPQVGFSLLAANNSPIATYGKCSLTLDLGL